MFLLDLFVLLIVSFFLLSFTLFSFVCSSAKRILIWFDLEIKWMTSASWLLCASQLIELRLCFVGCVQLRAGYAQWTVYSHWNQSHRYVDAHAHAHPFSNGFQYEARYAFDSKLDVKIRFDLTNSNLLFISTSSSTSPSFSYRTINDFLLGNNTLSDFHGKNNSTIGWWLNDAAE